MMRKELSQRATLPWDGAFCLGLGICLEIWVVIQHFLLTHYVINAVLGFFASLILIYGVVRILMRLSYGGGAIPWVILSGVFYLLFRVHDIIYTLNINLIMRWANTAIDLDELAQNMLLVCSGMSILIGVVRALQTSYQSQRLLMERNAALDREVAEHKASEQRARVSQEMLSVLINAIPAAVFLVDRPGVVVVHNEHFARVFGGAVRDFRGVMLRDILPAHLYEAGRNIALRIIENDSHTEHFLGTDDGRIYDSREYRVLDDEGNVSHVAVVAYDITERLAAEESRLLLETAVGHAAESIMITDKEGRIEYVNSAFEAMTGYKREEIIGRTPSLLRSGHHDAEFYQALWQTIEAGNIWRGEFLNRRKDGELFREQATISPITDAQGMITHYVAVKRDITRERQLERQVQQAQKIEIIGTLAGGVAHDFNNVLSIILGHTELVLARLAFDAPLRRNLEIIARTASRSSKLTKRLLAFSRQHTEEAGPLQAASLVQEQINVLRVYLPANIVISEDINFDAGYINGEISEVQQVIVNLCTNASHAMQPGGGRLDISLAPVLLGRVLSTTTGELAAGAYIRLSIQDTGCGMDEETRHRIFEPFFTTKEPGVGTGLGLPMVHGSVTRFGGAVDVSSSPGLGTHFDVYWPRIEYTPVEEKSAEAIPCGDGRHVLIVDDMEDFNALTELNLVNYGFKVTPFANPREAVAFFTHNAALVDVVITDYMMPEMNGVELAGAMRRIRPDMPIVLLTGYASGITKENADTHGFNLVVRKPAASDALACGLLALLTHKEEVTDSAT